MKITNPTCTNIKAILITLAVALPLTGAHGQPVVAGATTSIYATVTDPLLMSFAADGALYVGRDASGSGGGHPDAVKIHRVAPGGSAVTEFGNASIPDPDAVIVDRTGVVSGIAGAVLVGGQTSPGYGRVSRIAPDGTVTALYASSTSYGNPSGFAFNSTGRLLFTDGTGGRVLWSDGAAPAILINHSDAFSIACDSTDRIVLGLGSTGNLLLYSANGTLINSNIASVREGSPLVRGPGGMWTTDIYAITVGGDLIRIALDGTLTTVGSGFSKIEGITFGPGGALYASDFVGDCIWIIAPPLPVLRMGAPANGTATLQWDSTLGRDYQLQSSTSLLPNSWTDAGTPVSGTGGELSTDLPIGPEATKFFRLRLGP